ncbi:MAG TPA: hypothetical protein VGE52_02815 [Pirellulales bacterium]
MAKDNVPPRIKPEKPHGCPLTPHPAGQWVAKIHGKVRYFGPWADLEGATRRYYETKAAIASGRVVDGVVDSEASGECTIGDLVDLYCDAKKQAVAAGELAERTYQEYRKDCQFLSDQLGRGRRVLTVGPADFSRMRAKLSEGVGPTRLANVLQRLRSIFKFGYDSELIDRPVRFGPGFKRPPQRLMRERRNAVGVLMYTADQIRAMLEQAKPQLKAMILLGINAGFGATDVSALPLAAVDLAGGWINFPRPKTQMPRRVPCWPETVAALQWVVDHRRDPQSEDDAALVFVTQKTRQRYVRFTAGGGKVDGVAVEFRKLTSALKLPGRFYDLRRTFRTIADETGDQVACGVVMGHVNAASDMGALYRQKVSDDRLRRVTNHVRSWLWPSASVETKKKAAPRKKATAKKKSQAKSRTRKPAKKRPAV